MLIHSATFVQSSPSVKSCPQSTLPEYAFIGRSNVGKSSLINMLTGYKGLAMTSQKPGKTQLINHFLINESWHLVDLPGYGYARRSLEQREQFRKLINQYVSKREALVNLFVLVDIRHEPQRIDLEFINEMGEKGIPFSIVFTKADKIGKQVQREAVEAYRSRLLEDWEELPPLFVTSASTGMGRDELLDYIGQLNRMIAELED
ncbi:ribosome biogenesis GTP-binding protein YihA/YsxC [uncultured Porphyromonas sp.]|uniref:ribosome biogenesis GTP-binding protein YihA/YsxC n=1 Tax=Porphyromonas sp. TaxID=1924944 RepID=UPI0026316236|nr:ribosome biogenesis GTP-binding protein YihA/YsxC [uncultured Porphyromonas sp.]